MPRAIIISNGKINDYSYYKNKIREDDYIICADGGIKHLLQMGVCPDLWLGDFDSCRFSELKSEHSELKSIETLKSSFISDVSHDFKTPLSIIQSYSKTLRKPNLDPETRKKYEDILDHNIRKLNNLTTNILNLSKLENPR